MTARGVQLGAQEHDAAGCEELLARVNRSRQEAPATLVPHRTALPVLPQTFLAALVAFATATLGAPLPAGTVAIEEPGRAVLAADLDGDGRVDPVIVYGETAGCRLGRLIGSEKGLALEPLRLSGAAGAAGTPRLFAPAIGDADGDGTADLLSADRDGILIRKGDGHGAFAPTAARLVVAQDLLLPLQKCSEVAPYLVDADGDGTNDLLLPVLGGVRLVRLAAAARPPAPSSAAPAAPPSAAPPGAEASEPELVTEPSVQGNADGIAFGSALPTFIGTGAARLGVLGPVLVHGSPRLDLTWWTIRAGSPVEPHRTSLALRPGESAAIVHPFDADGDGRPELAVVTTPTRVTKLLGEFGLSVYHASDRADTPVQPYFSTSTDINYWQLPALADRPAPGGSDLMLAFYRGLMTAHLNIELFRANASGSFESRAHDLGLDSDKEAEREYLKWVDVDGDGTLDLVVADKAGLRVHRGTANREKPIESAPMWTASTGPRSNEVQVSLGGSGAFSITFAGSERELWQDLDGDGLAEAVFLGTKEGGASAVTLAKLRPRAK